MASIFSKYKDMFLDLVTERVTSNLHFPLPKTGDKFNGYTKGDFIIVGGRKTSGKGSFILNNYVTSPIYQKSYAKTNNTPFDVKILYINTRKTLKATMERMIVNYTSYATDGSKVGVPALYGYSGSEYLLSKARGRKVVSKALNLFNVCVEKGYLTVSTGRKSLFEIEQLIAETLGELGEFDEEGSFIYNEESENTIPIIAIDDASGIYGENGNSALRNDAATLLAVKLKEMSKIYNALIVLGVPSHMSYRNKATAHISSIDEITPYDTYCDRSIILHNPLETNEPSSQGYETPFFVSPSSGVCYLRTGYIASNYMGASGVSFGYFMYPENGFMVELPPAEEERSLEEYHKRATVKIVKKNVKKDNADTDVESEQAEKDLNLN